MNLPTFINQPEVVFKSLPFWIQACFLAGFLWFIWWILKYDKKVIVEEKRMKRQRERNE